MDKVYFPQIQQHLRPSTLSGYRVIWQGQLKPRCEKLWLRETRTANVQMILDSLGKTGQFNSNSVKHIKSFLSGVFRLALQLDFYVGVNPVQQTSVPKVRTALETHAYSLEEVNSMLAALPEPAATIVATAAFSPVRSAELRGFRWENLCDDEIVIAHSVWRKHVTGQKAEPAKLRSRLSNRSHSV